MANDKSLTFQFVFPRGANFTYETKNDEMTLKLLYVVFSFYVVVRLILIFILFYFAHSFCRIFINSISCFKNKKNTAENAPWKWFDSFLLFLCFTLFSGSEYIVPLRKHFTQILFNFFLSSLLLLLFLFTLFYLTFFHWI